MEELTRFYDDHSDHDQIHFFEKLRLKLKRTLTLRVRNASRITNNIKDQSVVNNDLYNASIELNPKP